MMFNVYLGDIDVTFFVVLCLCSMFVVIVSLSVIVLCIYVFVLYPFVVFFVSLCHILFLFMVMSCPLQVVSCLSLCLCSCFVSLCDNLTVDGTRWHWYSKYQTFFFFFKNSNVIFQKS